MKRKQKITAYFRAAQRHDKYEVYGCCDALISVRGSYQQKHAFVAVFEPDDYSGNFSNAWYSDGYFWPRKTDFDAGDEEWGPEIKDQRVMALLFMHWMTVNP